MNKITYTYKDKTELTWYDIKKLFPQISLPDETIIKDDELKALCVTRQTCENTITLPEYKEIRKMELKTKRDYLETQPLQIGNNLFDFDDKARDRLDVAYKALSATDSIEWTMTDNKTATITCNDIKNVYRAGAMRSNILHEKYIKCKEQLVACATLEEVKVVDFE